MSTQPACKIIKPNGDDDDNSTKKQSLLLYSKDKEFSTVIFEKELIENTRIILLCYYPDDVRQFSTRLPDTFRELYQVILNNSEWSEQVYRIRSDTEFVIQYYDEVEHNCVKLDDGNWLECRKNVISLLSSRIGSSRHFYSLVLKFIITKLSQSSNRYNMGSIVEGLGTTVGGILVKTVLPCMGKRNWWQDRRAQEQRPVFNFSYKISEKPSILSDSEMQEQEICRYSSITSKRQYRKSQRVYGFSNDEDDDIISTTMKIQETETLSVKPFAKLRLMKKRLNWIETAYSFICLLNKADALDKLKDINSKPRIFTKPYECLSEVIKAVGEKIIIIVSQPLSHNFVPLIHDLIQIIYIYILHEYDSYHGIEDDSYVHDRRYPKVRGSFIEQTMLISKLNGDLKKFFDISIKEKTLIYLVEMNTGIDFYVISKQPSSLKSFTDTEQDFISFQLIIKAILESDSKNPLNSISTSLEICRKSGYEQKNKRFLEFIDQYYQKYASNKAINFYLTDTELKNELNTCFSSKSIQNICKLWFFIGDLLKQLPGNKKPITVYCGQRLRTDQLCILKTNVGGFISFTKFFSMSTSNIQAIVSSREGDFRPSLESVVFQLEIGNDNTNTRFLRITDSYEEQTFLFGAGSVFYIESAEKLNDHIWLCKLCINSDDESELNRIFKHYETEIGTSLTYLSLGIYLNEIGNENLAVEYYETLLSVAIDPDTISSINNNLAIIYERRKDLTTARKHWELASTIEKMNNVKTSTPPTEQKSYVIMADLVSNTSPIINHYNLACVYREAEYFDEALNECENALKLSTTSTDPVDVALIYSAFGSVYFSRKNYEEARKYFQMALDIVLVHRPTTDPLIDQYLNNIRLLNDLFNKHQSE